MLFENIDSIFYSWIRGGMLLLLFYHFIFYIKHKEEVYKYYSVYLLGVFIFLMKDVFTSASIRNAYEYIIFPIQFISFSFYIHFTRNLLNTHKEYPKWDKLSVKVSKILFITAVILIWIQFFWGYEIQKKVLSYLAPVLTIILVGGLAYVEIIKTKQGMYSLIGTVLLLIGANITALKMINGNSFLFDLKVHNMFYFYVGLVIQTIIYAFLLADVLKKIEVEKTKAELSLVKKSSQLYELRMIAFKNQMNPHFLFNSLNSINNFVIQNRKEQASNYIVKFSRLIRKVLQTTDKIFVTLEEEIKIAELYIKIEQVRLRNSFTYSICLDDTVEASEIAVPPLYMQPFIENAIWHGLQYNKNNGNLKISIIDKGDFIYTEIIDNGLGINMSKQNHKSYGLNIVKNRLQLIYGEENINIVIEDLSNLKQGNGTKVSMLFPKNKE
ncbi:sensor histidine kinase [Tenacibaculum amylolyticum]|uniref:sensor histidine kinase n=1 Tax=Tenacibaculum amylolyticum TaxID=104269 RepID=UPI0038931127